MAKSYADYMDEISGDELYRRLLAYGYFHSKVPPIFESETFADYCIKNPLTFKNKPHDFVRYDIMRNVNVPRTLGIPAPMAYERQCRVLRDNWDKIKGHFHVQTDGQGHVISRNHIQIMRGSDSLFEMNYDDWFQAGSPKDDLQFGNKFVVHADISTCFPSIYTHSIPWALAGKNVAKLQRNGAVWYNKIDKACQNVKYGETHGLLIGPHTSNLISEMILTVVDKKLYDNGWRYVRNIDDYTCFVKTKEDAENFITELAEQLSEFDLAINYKKNEIRELPAPSMEPWVQKLSQCGLLNSYGAVGYKQAKAYFDLAINQMKQAEDNAAVLNYAIKVLSNQRLTKNAIEYSWKMSMHLCLLYPYLMSIMEEYVFSPFEPPNAEIERFLTAAYEDGIRRRNYEECSNVIYIAMLRNLLIERLDVVEILQSADCVIKTMAYFYFQKNGEEQKISELHKDAMTLSQNDNDMDRNWLFAYEVLDASDLKDDWNALKKAGVTFVKKCL